MVLRLINATAANPGTTILLDGEAYVVKSNDISKSGKHGASKCRIEAVAVIGDKKKVLACPGSERFEVPMIEKKRAQVLSVSGDKASIMDMESYETIEVQFVEGIKEQIAPEKQVEYWIIEEKKVVMRVL